MGRSKRRRRRTGARGSRARRPEPGEEGFAGLPQMISAQDGEWAVRTIGPGHSLKVYRCPGCDQEIPAGAAHLVAWRSDGFFGPESDVADRRHWHRSCWRARATRSPTRQWW